VQKVVELSNDPPKMARVAARLRVNYVMEGVAADTDLLQGDLQAE